MKIAFTEIINVAKIIIELKSNNEFVMIVRYRVLIQLTIKLLRLYAIDRALLSQVYFPKT